MKKILILLMLSSIMIFAKNTGILLEKTDTQYGGIVDKIVIFIYEGDVLKNPKKQSELKVYKKILVDKVCQDKDNRELLSEGYKIMYVYPGKEKAAFFLIDECDDSSKE